MSRRSARRGIKRMDVLVVVASLVMSLALLLPGFRASHDVSQRTQCSNNLHNIVLSLENYHFAYEMYPMGAVHSGPNRGGDPPITAALGPSWWFAVIPYADQGVVSRIYAQIATSQLPGAGTRMTFCADDIRDYSNIHPVTYKGQPVLRYTLDRNVLPWMFCPNSPLPAMETPTGPVLLPSYVGIAGGCDIDPNSQDYQLSGGDLPGLVAPKTGTIYHNTHKGTGAAAGGIVTSSGMLPPCQHIRIGDCTDGTSNTMIVAEQGDWLQDQDPAVLTKYHGDPGWTVGGTGRGGGWLSGTTRVDPVPKVDTPGGPPAPWGADCWNITTVRYPPNRKKVMGATPLPGCSENHGINNPLQSAHPGVVLVGMTDGSVQTISQTTDLGVLLRLAIRDDGQTK
jgi:hypothetical protein